MKGAALLLMAALGCGKADPAPTIELRIGGAAPRPVALNRLPRSLAEVVADSVTAETVIFGSGPRRMVIPTATYSPASVEIYQAESGVAARYRSADGRVVQTLERIDSLELRKPAAAPERPPVELIVDGQPRTFRVRELWMDRRDTLKSWLGRHFGADRVRSIKLTTAAGSHEIAMTSLQDWNIRWNNRHQLVARGPDQARIDDIVRLEISTTIHSR